MATLRTAYLEHCIVNPPNIVLSGVLQGGAQRVEGGLATRPQHGVCRLQHAHDLVAALAGQHEKQLHHKAQLLQVGSQHGVPRVQVGGAVQGAQQGC